MVIVDRIFNVWLFAVCAFVSWLFVRYAVAHIGRWKERRRNGRRRRRWQRGGTRSENSTLPSLR